MSIIFPSSNGWITPRTAQGQVTTNNSQIILNQTIDKIDKVLLNLPNLLIKFIMQPQAELLKLSEIYTDENHTKSLAQLDITRYVVEKAAYDTLPTYKASHMPNCFGPQYTNNTWYYEHKGSNIVLPNDIIKGNIEFIGNPITTYVISSAVYNYLYNNGHKDGKLYAHTDYLGTVEGTVDFEITYSDSLDIEVYSNTPDIQSIPFRIYYTPLGDSVKLQVPKTNPQVNQFCIPYSQQQPLVDNTTLGREMQSVANRAGCEKREVVRTLTNISQKRPLGAYYSEKDANGKPTGNVWRLTGERIEIYSETFMQVVETWSKNWSYRSENVPINREFRSWNIPADVVQRNLLWQDYCLITDKETLQLPPNEIISPKAKSQLLYALIKYNGSQLLRQECNVMWFYTKDGNTRKGVALSCSAFGFGNSLVFNGKTQDNLSAGVQRVKKDSTDDDYQFCKDVYYCNDDGTLDSMYIQIGGKLLSNSTAAYYRYPEYSDDGTVKLNGIPVTDEKLFKDDQSFKILKDPCEQLNFTYQLHLLTDDGFLVIGSTWASSNPLVKQRDTDQPIKVWKLTQYLPQGAQVMTSAYGTEQQSNLFEVDADNLSITFNPANEDGTSPNNGVGVCITDEQNNVLIAFNSNQPATFYLIFTHNYKAIAQALKDNQLNN